jgi:hypothetical protein
MPNPSSEPPLKLPKLNLRPPKTEFLMTFEEHIARLNDFYWGVQAGFHTLNAAAGQTSKTTDGFLPTEISKRWSLNVDDVPGKIAAESERLKHVFLVQATTFYEDYLASILRDELTRVLLPKGGPMMAAVEADLQGDYLESVTKRVVSGKYSERAKKLHKALGIDPSNTQPKLSVQLDLLTIAGEARNCIVHTGGVIDDRASKALSAWLHNVVTGQRLQISEQDLFKLVGALKGHVEAVDLLVRLRR